MIKKDIKFRLFQLMTIIIFHAIMIRMYYIDNYNNISMILLALSFLYMLPRIKILKFKKYARANFSIIILLIAFFMSSFVNSWNLDGTLFYMLKIILLFWFMEYANEIGRKKEVLKIFMKLGILYSIYILYSITKDPFLAWKHDMVYPLGTKFSVSYLMIMNLVLYLYNYKDELKNKMLYKVWFVLLVALSVYVSIEVDCSTGIVANMLLVFIYFMPFKAIKKFIQKPINAIIIFIIACSILLLFYETILNIEIIRNFVENVLNRSITLTGRVYVYDNVFAYLKGHWLFGYGYNSVASIFNNNMIIGSNAYALNTQNALLEYWLYGGIFAVFGILFMIYNCFKGNYLLNESEKEKNNAIVTGIYVFLILGMVEITINFYLLLFLAILNVGINKEKNIYEKVNK